MSENSNPTGNSPADGHSTTDPSAPKTGPQKRTGLIIGAIVGVLLLVAVAFGVTQCGADSEVTPNGTPTATASPTPTDEPTGPSTEEPSPDASPAPDGQTDAPADGSTEEATPDEQGSPDGQPAPDQGDEQETLAPVAPDATAESGEGISMELTNIESVQGEATVPGERTGPAVRFTLNVTNDGDSEIDLGLVVVNAYYGEARDPANTFMQPGAQKLEGKLAPGQSASGVYLFAVPVEERGNVQVSVDRSAGKPVTVFEGAFPG